MDLFEYKCALPAPEVSVDAELLFAINLKPLSRALTRLENALSDPEVKPSVIAIKVDRKDHNGTFRTTVLITLKDQRALYILEQACQD